jgi:hypothetical protein
VGLAALDLRNHAQALQLMDRVTWLCLVGCMDYTSVLPFMVESDVNGHDHSSSDLPEPLLVPTQPVAETESNQEVLLEAFTDVHYQQMLQEASILYPFNPNTIGATSIAEYSSSGQRVTQQSNLLSNQTS